ncbi:MAG: hypothetical protein A2X94_11665 [Bdellovibrionales bacterium GWB1_55_8]|nr:MAG: hypothetical protein A2X94_11665 [Bdellovibrionales bacterium GWB1_55_8]
MNRKLLLVAAATLGLALQTAQGFARENAILPFFTLPSMTKGFSLLAESMYDHKAEFMRKATAATELLPSPKLVSRNKLNDSGVARAFVLRAVFPLVESTHTEFIQLRLLPSYQSSLQVYAGQFGFRSLSDFPHSPMIVNAALQLTRASAESLKTYCATMEQQQFLASLLSQIGRAVVSSNAGVTVREVGLMADSDGFMQFSESMLKGRHTRGIMIVLTSLLEFLKD